VVATRTSQKVAELKEEIERLHGLQKELVDLEELQKMAPDHDFSEDLKKIQGDIDKEEFRLFLGGKYDKKNALLEIFSGAGGQDAQDWVAMLLRMYEKYCAKKGFRMAVLHQSFGDGGGPDGRIGVKSVTLEIKGKYAYGLLRREAGVHRLVRISPFSSQKLRHTSFALVDVLPEIDEDESQVEIKPNELRIDTFKSSGPGGQYVNKTESAVRITHLPTGLVVASQSERLQGKNKDNAMKILLAKLHQLKKDEHQKKLKEIKGEAISVSWGNQIRSYVLHPYKMVKDLRTQYETSQAEEVLDGELDQFINEEIKLGS
jgi:peptide chain release factor 2